MNAIELERITFAYDPARPILRAASLSVVAGERVGLSGPIGCGKSTLLHIALGLILPDSGEIRHFGVKCTNEAAFQVARTRAGLLFQDPDDQLFCPTVGEDVAFGPMNLGLARDEVQARVREALEAVGLAGYETRIAHRLSGGEKRLAALAGLLAMRPEALLLDEPFAGLDDAAIARVLDVLRTLDAAMLIVSHQQEVLAGFVSRRMALREGQIVPH